MPKGKKQKQDYTSSLPYEIAGILFLGFFILSYISFFSKEGDFVLWIATTYRELFGILFIFAPILFGIIGFFLIYLREDFIDKTIDFLLSIKSLGYILFVISIAGFLSTVKYNLGGILGNTISDFLISLFDKSGSYAIFLTITLVAIALIFSTSVYPVINFLLKNADKIRSFKNNFYENFKTKINYIISLFSKPKKEKKQETLKQTPQIQEVLNINQPTIIDLSSTKDEKEKDEDKEDGIKEIEKQEKKEKQLSVIPWQLPDISILKTTKSSQTPKELIDQSDEIIKSLNEFGVDAEIVNVEIGPVITRYELRPAEGVKVREITNLSNDIALRLAAAPIRIEAPIPGKSAIGIEVPNKIKDIVFLKDILEKIPKEGVDKKLFFALGKDISGNFKIADLTRMPHLLIAGATGAGKSVCLNSIIASYLFRLTPDDVRFLLIDPKRVELSAFKGIPHLASPVITDVKQASAALIRAIDIMDKRYSEFAEVGVRNLESFNIKNPDMKKFYFVIIIDELADLMLQVGHEVEKSICRLAQLGRATGIHLIIATQRPSVNVITGLIKANIPSRIAFAVVSQMDSRIILDYGGAENLLGSGDMLFLPIDAARPTRMQGAFISDDDIKSLVKFWANQEKPEYLEEFLDLPSDSKKETIDEDVNIDDELFKESVRIILENNQASVSILQRKLKIGYARAGRLIDAMEKRGIVGPFAGSKQREILVSWDYLEKL